MTSWLNAKINLVYRTAQEPGDQINVLERDGTVTLSAVKPIPEAMDTRHGPYEAQETEILCTDMWKKWPS